MVRSGVLMACFYAAAFASAQDDSTMFRGAGLFRASAAISPGIMPPTTTNIYVNGKLEYFTDERVSFRGESFWYVDSPQEPAFMAQNSQIGAGPFYHFGKGRLDAALGFEAGVSFAQPLRWRSSPNYPGEVLVEYEELRVIPNLALCGGITYTVWDHFHLFLDARYVYAQYTGGLNGTVFLDELILSGGLGFQFRVKK